jgi:hypothetical protein
MYGHIPNVVGIWVVRVAIGWLAWQLTGSAFWLGVLAAADSMPAQYHTPPLAGIRCGESLQCSLTLREMLD